MTDTPPTASIYWSPIATRRVLASPAEITRHARARNLRGGPPGFKLGESTHFLYFTYSSHRILCGHPSTCRRFQDSYTTSFSFIYTRSLASVPYILRRFLMYLLPLTAIVWLPTASRLVPIYKWWLLVAIDGSAA